MNINIDYQSRIPIYEQIENEIIKYISLGILKPGEKLPSIREFAVDVGVNPNTIKRVYSDLESKNIINTISTKGNFIPDNVSNVVDIRIDNIISVIQSNMDELYKLGLKRDDIISKLK